MEIQTKRNLEFLQRFLWEALGVDVSGGGGRGEAPLQVQHGCSECWHPSGAPEQGSKNTMQTRDTHPPRPVTKQKPRSCGHWGWVAGKAGPCSPCRWLSVPVSSSPGARPLPGNPPPPARRVPCPVPSPSGPGHWGCSTHPRLRVARGLP